MTSTATPNRSTGATYTALTRVRGATPLFALSSCNVLATSLQIFALSVYVFARTGSAFWSSVAFAAGFLPQFLGGLVLTSLADRWSARPVLLGSSVLRVATPLTLAVATSQGVATGWPVAVVAATTLWGGVPGAAQSGLVSRLLTGELYVLGRSVFNLISSAGQLVGLAAGGAVVTGLGVPTAFLVAAVVQVVGVVAALRIPGVPVRGVRQPWGWTATWRGNRALLADATVRRLLLSWWVPTTLLVGAESLVVALASGRDLPPSAAGILLAAFPAGAAAGDVVVGRWLGPARQRLVVPWLFVLVGAGLVPAGLAIPLPAVVGCLAVASVGTAYQLGGQRSFLAAVPEERRGLAFGLFLTGLMAGQGVGPLLAGGLAGSVGAGAAVSMLGATVLLVAPALARRPTTCDS